jgi:hypothetical protein
VLPLIQKVFDNLHAPVWDTVSQRQFPYRAPSDTRSRHKPLNDKTNGELRSFNRIHPANALVLTGYQSASQLALAVRIKALIGIKLEIVL